MNTPIVKRLLPHGIAILVFVVLSFGFFSAYVFDGKVLQQPDNQKAAASQVEMYKYKELTGKYPLWTSAYFSGMPTYQIHQEVKGNLTQPIFRASLLGQSMTAPHAEVLLAMLCMYILLITMRLDWRIALMGAASFGLSSFNMDIIEAGHSTKMVALAYAPLILAGAILAFRKEYLLGSSVFALATALQLYSNHYQITYYTFIILLVLGIVELVSAIKNKAFADFGKSAASLIVGLALGVLSNLAAIWTTQEYQTESQRGVPNLSSSERPKEGGLDKKYATDWSYGVGESFTLLVQNAVGGGASQSHLDTKTFENLRGQIIPSLTKQGLTLDKATREADKQISSLFYTGSQPFVGVSIYWGAIFIFLFIMGLALIEDRKKWWLAIASLIMLMIAWGKNFFFFDLMFEYFPLFNKFRAVTQALGLGQLLLIVLAGLSLQAIFDASIPREKKLRSLYIGAGVTALLAFLSTLNGGAGKQDTQMQREIVAMLEEDRTALLRADIFRAIALVGLTTGLIWLYLNNRLKASFAVIGIAVLTLLDFWTIGKRILPTDKFETPKEANAELEPQAADKIIMEDKDPHFRVFDLRQGLPFTNAQTSMFHKSVGGYHAAKLMIYQEMIEKHLSNIDPQKPIQEQKILPLYSMLNAKYIILNDDVTGVMPNPSAYGNAWFVKNIKIVDNADTEITEVGNINPRFDVVIQKKFADIIGANFTPQYDSSATIALKSYTPDKLEYEYSANGDQLAVFSEIYYPMEKGWKMTIDGQPAQFVKANYILRAAKLPSGKHNVIMTFEPKSYYTGETVSMIASGLLLLLMAGSLFLYYRQKGLPEVDALPEEDIAIVEKPRPSAVKQPISADKAQTPKPTLKRKK